LGKAQAVKSATEPSNVIGSLAGGDEFRLCGGGRNAPLEFRLPMHRPPIEKVNESTHRASSVRACGPIRVREGDESVSVRQIRRVQDAEGKSTFEVSQDVLSSGQVFVTWSFHVACELGHWEGDVGASPSGQVVERTNQVRVNVSQSWVSRNRAVGVEQERCRRKRSSDGVAVRETKLLDEVSCQRRLREHDRTRRRGQDVDTEVAGDWAVVSAVKTSEQGAFEELSFRVVGEREKNVVDVKTKVDGVGAIRPVHK
jgi:hypothetical protein